jgi:hypothetical protein
MYGMLENIYYYSVQFNLVLAEESNAITFFKNREIDPSLILKLFLLLGCVILSISIGVYRYNRWKKYKEFETEMKSLELDPEAEGTLANMVKRYSMNEPVNVLFSSRLFDEMAAIEIQRVLASSASAKLKANFIDTVYNIRVKTYNPDWVANDPQSQNPVLESSNTH